MTFRHLIDITRGKIELNSLIYFTCENDRVEPKFNDDLFIPPDAEVELHYHFWHHMNDEFPADEIQNALDNHEFAAFKKYYMYWTADYLPCEVWIIYRDEHVGNCFLHCDYMEELFNNITFAEYECG